MSDKFSLDSYIDVAERILLFKQSYPNGSLQTIDWGTETIGERIFVYYQAAAYREDMDPRPGHGTAWEPFPGPTSYTRDSELMNAETAAWGRAIVALGIVANRKIASKQEVRARTDRTISVEEGPPAGALTPVELTSLRNLYKESGWSADDLRLNLTAVGAQDVSDVRKAMGALSTDQGRELSVLLFAAVTDATVEEEAA
jgi:hypothetical protein